jgi:DNA-binding response OmpR family regulator
VVEDEADVSEMIRYNLGKEGYDVRVAANGTDALRQVKDIRPDVILLDIMVPHLNGWEICRRLKQDPETAAVAVIMVTGRVEEGDKVLGFEMGADDYVTSPSRRGSCWPACGPSPAAGGSTTRRPGRSSGPASSRSTGSASR